MTCIRIIFRSLIWWYHIYWCSSECLYYWNDGFWSFLICCHFVQSPGIPLSSSANIVSERVVTCDSNSCVLTHVRDTIFTQTSRVSPSFFGFSENCFFGVSDSRRSIQRMIMWELSMPITRATEWYTIYRGIYQTNTSLTAVNEKFVVFMTFHTHSTRRWFMTGA